MNEFLGVFKKYATFTGRARRREYWMFQLFYTLFAFLFVGLDVAINLSLGTYTNDGQGYTVLTAIYGIALYIPVLALGFRRLHDAGYSAWWLFIGLIPLVGGIVLFVFTLQDSQPGSNKWGDNPKSFTTYPNMSY
ncbi:DUF805 domain-containing protein [Deinococcus detaillensis]|uniref:DUF805 domain-containing protein n=1 Tax=Deinococcus detaillensis TaxID=2592048 RepID=A0A553V0S1_9DEIO|nr:DUF805 domain-containing protein [Deinococcus detaillensis]TSA86066.1 DUF805 domain-containing protein [Deinococcus detaillensis]